MRILVSAVIGAFVVFMWGAVSWAALDLWGDAAGTVAPEIESRMLGGLDEHLDETGVYFAPMPAEPGPDATAEAQAEAMEAWAARHREGPVAMVVFRQEGFEPMGASILATGLVVDFVAALLVAAAMVAVGGGFGRRFAVGLAMAVFAALTGHGMYWNWFAFPESWSAAMAADQIIGWSLATLAMAGLLRPRVPVAG